MLFQIRKTKPKIEQAPVPYSPEKLLETNRTSIVKQGITEKSNVLYYFKDPRGEVSGWRVGVIDDFSEKYNSFWTSGGSKPADAHFIKINQLGHGGMAGSVSYTHLTLPTIYSV